MMPTVAVISASLVFIKITLHFPYNPANRPLRSLT
jgi:hypothetical protein